MRINEQEMFMQIAELVSQRSTCCRKQVGAVIVNQSRIVSMGYNGTARGNIHCRDYFFDKWKNYYINTYPTFEKYLQSKIFFDEHAEFSNNNELHSEMNAILFTEKKYLDNCELYTTLSPCIGCRKLLLASNIKKVYYRNLYDREHDFEILRKNHVEVIHLPK